MTDTKKARSRTEIDDSGKWTDDELDAMKEHNKELKAAAKRELALRKVEGDDFMVR